MNAALIVVVALGGGAGAAGRFLLDGLINTGREFRLPVGTFSTASFETVRLARSGRITAAAINGLGMLVVSVAAATAGILLGGTL